MGVIAYPKNKAKEGGTLEIITNSKNKVRHSFIRRKLLYGDEVIQTLGVSYSTGTLIINTVKNYNGLVKFEKTTINMYHLGFILGSYANDIDSKEALLIINNEEHKWFCKFENDRLVFALISYVEDYRVEDDLLYINDFVFDLASYTLDTCVCNITLNDLEEDEY